jgi:hypothetical protein
MASLGPMRRSPRVSVLNVALLRLRRKPLCGLASDQNLPFLNEHFVVLNRPILVRVASIHRWALVSWFNLFTNLRGKAYGTSQEGRKTKGNRPPTEAAAKEKKTARQGLVDRRRQEEQQTLTSQASRLREIRCGWPASKRSVPLKTLFIQPVGDGPNRHPESRPIPHAPRIVPIPQPPLEREGCRDHFLCLYDRSLFAEQALKLVSCALQFLLGTLGDTLHLVLTTFANGLHAWA